MKSTGRLWLLAVCLLCGLVCTQAQEQEKKQLPREVPSPEKAARKMTDRMKEELQLTDKQYDKLYKLNLKEQQEHFATMTERGNGQRPLMGSRPGRGGARPPMDGGMGPGMGGGRPPMGAPGERPVMEKDNVEKMQKAAAKKEKKIKKILTAEQYAKWQEMCQPQEPPHPQDHPHKPNL